METPATPRHTAIRKILNTSAFKVDENKTIMNGKLGESFDNIRNITDFIKEERQLTWLEHVLKMAQSKTQGSLSTLESKTQEEDKASPSTISDTHIGKPWWPLTRSTVMMLKRHSRNGPRAQLISSKATGVKT
jgi:hypothetical protein